MANLKNLKIIEESPIHDTVKIAASTATKDLVFFSVPKGQDGKTKIDTNLERAGMLEAGRSFSLKAFRLAFNPDIALADAQAIMKNSLFEFKISDKVVFSAPLSMFGQINASASVTVGKPKEDNLLVLANIMKIKDGISFRGEISFNPEISLSAACSVKLLMEGFYYRPLN